MLRARVERGPLPPDLLACAQGQQAVVLLDKLHRDPTQTAEVAAWVESANADDALTVAELLAPHDPEVAAVAAARARAEAASWEGPQERATQAARLLEVEARLDPERAQAWARGLMALGIVGPPLDRARAACPDCTEPALDLSAPRPPDADDLVACKDLARLWTVAYSGGAYGTERDCLVRATEVLDGDARASAARLALILALGHRDRQAALIVAHRVAEVLPGDPAVAARVASLHAALGDPTGAARWEATTRSDGSR